MVRCSVGPICAVAAVFSCGAAHLTAGFQVSCCGARTVYSGAAEFCPMVDWLAGNLYNSTTLTMYNTGQQLSFNQQDAVARFLAESLIATAEGNVVDACRSAVQRLACVTAFPYCQTAGDSASSVSHTPPCRLQCEQVNRICRPLFQHEKPSLSLDCADYTLSRNCFVHVPHAKFLLDPQQGPYDCIPVLYIAVLACWAVMGSGWWYLTDVVYKEEVLAVTRSFLAVPILRALTATAALVFWVECRNEGDMCSTDTASGLAMLYPFAEAVQLYFYLAAAKGWGVTRLHLSRGAWQQIAVLAFGFYLTHAILQGSLSPPSRGWMALAVSTYGLLYVFILRSACVEMAVLQGQSDKLAAGAFTDAVRSLRHKYTAFRAFLALLLVELCLEVSCRYLLASEVVSFFTLIALYETINAVATLGVAACFAPRPYSAFHFMVPTSLECDDLPAVGVGVGGDGEDRHMERVRRALSIRRLRGRENTDDVESMEEVRRDRMSRPFPVVHTILRGAQWWVRGRKDGYSEPFRARELGVAQEAEGTALLAQEEGPVDTTTGIQLAGIPVLGSEAHSASIDLFRLAGAMNELTAAGDAQTGVAPETYPHTGRRREAQAVGRAKVIVLTCPAPDSTQAEVELAMLHPAPVRHTNCDE